jgi:hypothetical protein
MNRTGIPDITHDSNTTVAHGYHPAGQPCALRRPEQPRALIVRVHSSNEWANTPDYAVIHLTEALCAMVRARITTVQALGTQEGLTSLAHIAFWDAHARYLDAVVLFPDPDEDNEPPALQTCDGEVAHAVLDTVGMAVVAVLPPLPEEAWSPTDSQMLEVTTEAARWTCRWGDDVCLSTWDVPLRLFAPSPTPLAPPSERRMP